MIGLNKSTTLAKVDLDELEQRARSAEFGSVRNLRADVLLALIAEVRAHRWIPCSERMPKVGELVLFRGLHWNEPELGRLCAEDDGSPDGWELDDETRYYLSDVTHWMPLPPPPAVKEPR